MKIKLILLAISILLYSNNAWSMEDSSSFENVERKPKLMVKYTNSNNIRSPEDKKRFDQLKKQWEVKVESEIAEVVRPVELSSRKIKDIHKPASRIPLSFQHDMKVALDTLQAQGYPVSRNQTPESAILTLAALNDEQQKENIKTRILILKQDADFNAALMLVDERRQEIDYLRTTIDKGNIIIERIIIEGNKTIRNVVEKNNESIGKITDTFNYATKEIIKAKDQAIDIQSGLINSKDDIMKAQNRFNEDLGKRMYSFLLELGYPEENLLQYKEREPEHVYISLFGELEKHVRDLRIRKKI